MERVRSGFEILNNLVHVTSFYRRLRHFECYWGGNGAFRIRNIMCFIFCVIFYGDNSMVSSEYI